MDTTSVGGSDTAHVRFRAGMGPGHAVLGEVGRWAAAQARQWKSYTFRAAGPTGLFTARA